MLHIIDLRNKVDNPSCIINHLEENIDVKGLSNTSLVFQLRGGVVRLWQKRKEEFHCMPWISLLSSPLVHSLFLENISVEFMNRLPLNIKTLYYTNHRDLLMLTEWIEDGRVENFRSELRLKYLGKWDTHLPSFGRVNRHLVHVETPLQQHIGDFLETNPHVRTVGVDFDHQENLESLHRTDVNFVLWSSHPHNIHIAHKLHENKKKILYSAVF